MACCTTLDAWLASTTNHVGAMTNSCQTGYTARGQEERTASGLTLDRIVTNFASKPNTVYPAHDDSYPPATEHRGKIILRRVNNVLSRSHLLCQVSLPIYRGPLRNT